MRKLDVVFARRGTRCRAAHLIVRLYDSNALEVQINKEKELDASTFKNGTVEGFRLPEGVSGMRRRIQSSRRKNLLALALGASVMAVGIFLTVSAQSPQGLRSSVPRMESTMQAASTVHDNPHRSTTGFTQNVNFYYSLIDDQRVDTASNRRYHNEIENVEYNGGFEERVGALLMCGSKSLVHTITFVGRSCDKFIAVSHAFYEENKAWHCEDGDYGQVQKIARNNDGASHSFDSAARARHPWHGGLDPGKLDNYEWITKSGPLAVNERGRVDNKRFGLGGGDTFMNLDVRHNDVQMLRLHAPAPSSKGVGTACSGTSNLEFVNISKMTDYLPLRQCFIHTRMQREELTGVYQGRNSQLSIYRNTEPCHVVDTVERNTTGLVFKHNCPAHIASSGAPIMCEIDAQYKVVGIHSGNTYERNKIQDPSLSTGRDYNIGVGFNDKFLEDIRN